MKSIAVFLYVFVISNLVSAAPSSREMPYYGEAFYQDLSQGVSNTDLIKRIQQVLRSSHRRVEGSYDQISDSCFGDGCYGHVILGYDRARIWMMGVYYLVQDGDTYALPDVYCSNLKRASEFPSNPPAPRQIPLGTVLNTEHTWPQSKFTGKFDREMQKSDLHHLFPTDSQLNSIRGNNEFGEVQNDAKPLKCRVSRFGKPASGGRDVFEPPSVHRGNVARALFYFSLRYGMPLGRQQEQVLRKWHREDSVDEEEIRRNNEIMRIQGNRNPFVDYPELADQIQSFN